MTSPNNKHEGTLVSTVDGVDVIECTECGFAHINPLPSEVELKKFYEKEFYDSEKPDYFSHAEEDKEWWMDTYRNQYSLITPHIRGKHVLDIGSGPGYFLKCGQELGFDVLGVEPSPAACDYARRLGVEVTQGFFTPELVAQQAPFDAINLNLVLEHTPNPRAMILDAKSVLVDHGIIFILVPNDFNALQRAACVALGLPQWWVVPTHHLNYFSFKSITKLLESEGFDVVDTLATFPMEFFLLSGENYIGNPELGRACHAKRKQFERNLYMHSPETLNALYRSFAREGIGRESIVIAQKRK